MSTPKFTHSLLFLTLIHGLVAAEYTPISVGPLLTCDLTTFSCPGVTGCCTIGGCCGSGCCANGYTCINEGTSAEACCSVYDETLCGTKTVPAPGSDTGSGSPSSGRTCTTIHNCPRDPITGLAWTCLLGETCGFSYRQCNPCPYIGSSSGDPSASLGTDSNPPSPSSSSSSSAGETSSGGGSGDSKPSLGIREESDVKLLFWVSFWGLVSSTLLA